VFNEGLFNTQVTSLANVKKNAVCAGTYGSGIFVSRDNGGTWIKADSGLANLTVLSLTATDSFIFAGTMAGVCRAANNGTFYWTSKRSGMKDSSIVSLACFGSTILAGTRCGLFFSSTNGDTWQSPGSVPCYEVPCCAIAGDAAYAGVSGEGIYVSLDKGLSTWTRTLSSVQYLSFPTFITMVGTTPYAGNAGILRSTDYGDNWIKADTGLMIKAPDCMATNGIDMVAGAFRGGVSYATHPDAKWTRINNATLTDSAVISLLISGGSVYAGTASTGVWRTTVPGVAGTLDNVPQGKTREQAGFAVTSWGRSTNVIRFSLVNAQPVAIRIFDLFGREVASFVAANPGPHAFYWNTRNVAAGCYTVQMRAGSKTCVKNVPVVR
jgi:hypothetical protein